MSDKDAGSLAPESCSNIDRQKLKLTAEDFHVIDADSSNRLSLLELTNASRDGKFTGEKQTAVEQLRDELSKSPPQAIDADNDKQKVFPSWHTAEFAMGQISKDDFKRIDANQDNVLSDDELKAATENKELTPMTQHAAQVLARDEISADVRNVVHRDSVMNWHDLDPTFKDISTADVGQLMAANSAEIAIKAGHELIRRVDFAMTESEAIESIKSIEFLQQALKENRDFAPDAEKKDSVLTDKPLSDERRLQIHEAVVGDMASIDMQIRARTSFAELLDIYGKHEEAQKIRDEAITRSDFLMKKAQTEKGEVRLIDLMKAEANQLTTDSAATGDKARSADMVNAAGALGHFVRQPIETRILDARSNLAVTFGLNSDGTYYPRIDTGASRFDATKAEQRAKEARDIAADILGIAQTSSPTEQSASLLGSTWKQMDPKTKLNYYRDADGNGQVDLFEKVRELKQRNDSWKATVFGKETALD